LVPGHINEEVVAMAFISGLPIPQVSKALICKYLTDLKLIGALEK
jgi:hypothetical protein